VASDSGALTEKWRQSEQVATAFQSSTPAVDDDHVYVGGLGREFYALSRADGRVVWSRERDGSMSDSSPYYHDGVVYVGSGGGSVYAFDAADGSTVWRREGSSAVTSAPIVRDGILYVGRNDGILWALDAADGSVIFEFDVGSPIHANVAYSRAEDTVYVSTADVGVSAHDAGDGGRQRWAQTFGTDVGSSAPVVNDREGLVYFASNEVRGLAADDGTVAWGTSFLGASAGSSPVFDDEGVYVGGGSGIVYRLPLGEQLLVSAPTWEFQTWDVSITADLALSDGVLLVGSLNGNCYALDAESGSAVASVSLDCELRAAPVVRGGEVYLAGEDEDMYAFELPDA